jgi:hypothetical protein
MLYRMLKRLKVRSPDGYSKDSNRLEFRRSLRTRHVGVSREETLALTRLVAQSRQLDQKVGILMA